ncbi:MAG TPA: RusA family crossover junction endodeoxyribonuclease [Thermodesulfobacteriota bacterium]
MTDDARTLVVAVILGEPVPKGRPRLGLGRVYTPRATRLAEEAIGWNLKLAMRGGPFLGDVRVALRFRETTRRADLDNLVKLVLDAANGVVWRDDRQVVALDAAFVDDGEPRTEVRVWIA